MPFVNVGESQIRYDSHGEGPALVFAHGVGGNRVSWFQQVPHFSRTHRVITFDHRAFGGSTDVEGEGRSRYVGDMLALLDALAIERAVLIGQSMGGGTCAAFACRHPDRVRGLVIADLLSGLEAQEPLASQLHRTAAANRALSQVERVLGPSFRELDPESTLLYLQLASFNSVNASTVRGAMTPWTAQALSETGAPILFIVGEQDILFTPAQVEAVASMTTGARLVKIAGAGHSAYFEQPQAFNTVLDEFLAAMPQ